MLNGEEIREEIDTSAEEHAALDISAIMDLPTVNGLVLRFRRKSWRISRRMNWWGFRNQSPFRQRSVPEGRRAKLPHMNTGNPAWPECR